MVMQLALEVCQAMVPGDVSPIDSLLRHFVGSGDCCFVVCLLSDFLSVMREVQIKPLSIHNWSTVVLIMRAG